MPRQSHRVAVVVLCEAEGVDERDASAGAQMAISHALQAQGARTVEAQALVASSLPPSCAKCGARPEVDESGNMGRHVMGERFYPDQDPNDPSYKPTPCPGTGQPPHQPDELVVGFDRADGLSIRARVFETMDAGMALGNGYLWAGPTLKAFR